MKTTARFLSGWALVLAGATAWAQAVPPLINYQGQLLTPAGTPIPTGDYELEINLYPTESGGVAVWGPQKFNGLSGVGLGPKAVVVDGRFNVILGPQDTGARDLSSVVAVNASVFLELKVGTSGPIAPRQQMLTAPYALRASSAAKLNGFDWSSLFSGGDPVNGNLGVGVPPPSPSADAKADFNGRLRVRQAGFGSAGIWFNQNAGGDRAFVGMLDSSNVGFYTAAGAGWAFTVNLDSGDSSALALNLGPARLSGNEFKFGGIDLKSFHVGGVDDSYFEGDVWATAFHNNSDERLKENIETIEDPLRTLQAIRGVRYNFKDNTARKDLNSHQRRIGVVAQEVQKVLPEAVTAAPDGFLSVDYNALVPVLLQGMKEQQKQIDALKEEVAAIKTGRR